MKETRKLAGAAAAALAAHMAAVAPVRADYPIVDTGQTSCYYLSTAAACPSPGVLQYGQDAQHTGNVPSYALSADGSTVYDNVTGLTWERSPDTNGDGSLTQTDKLTYAGALAQCAARSVAGYGGYSDWRLPTIKELYSLIHFSGTDPAGYAGTDTSGLTPFIDTGYFRFAYGQTSAGERIIDSQYASSTVYACNPDDTGATKLFGVNFADGRIKGYDTTMPDGSTKTFFVQCVRGNPSYGVNTFVDNDDGTITDVATGLMWSKADSAQPMDWPSALWWVQTRNAAGYLGHDDWRLPDAKELQSILDYSRCPDTTFSAAIDPIFFATAFVDEGGRTDWPWYWSSTTHVAYDGMGASGIYFAFGRAGGWQKATPSATCYTLFDVHGAGAQRSDPKRGTDLTTIGLACGGLVAHGLGPQGDLQRASNYIRLVRNATGVCGNAVIEYGEQCDGASLGSCSTCAQDCRCLLCAPVPQQNCFVQRDAGKASVSIADKADDAGDALAWKWNDGDATAVADLGVATGSRVTYEICIYDGSTAAQPLRSLRVAGGGDCGGRACWKATTSGYRYRNSGGNGDGILSMLLSAGVDGKSRVQVKGRGLSLLPPPPALTMPVTVQLLASDDAGTRCWQTTFTGASANETGRFKARGP